MPAATELSSFNRFILAFWMTQPEAVDNAQAWEQFDPVYRQQVLDEYHAAGIALMVSAFGSTGGFAFHYGVGTSKPCQEHR